MGLPPPLLRFSEGQSQVGDIAEVIKAC